MYVPRHFQVEDVARCHALMRAESFALLVTIGEDGAPFATHLPVLLDADRGPLGTLRAHVARANPQQAHLGTGRPALVVFQGPHAYVSPSWYASHPSVPTWNYVAVHAYGVPGVLEGAAARSLLADLVSTYEAGRQPPWRMDALAPAYVDGMLRGIVAFEIPIDRLEGKVKLSQNRDARDRAGAVAGLRGTGDPLAHAVADLMAEGGGDATRSAARLSAAGHQPEPAG